MRPRFMTQNCSHSLPRGKKSRPTMFYESEASGQGTGGRWDRVTYLEHGGLSAVVRRTRTDCQRESCTSRHDCTRHSPRRATGERAEAGRTRTGIRRRQSGASRWSRSTSQTARTRLGATASERVGKEDQRGRGNERSIRERRTLTVLMSC